MIAVLDALGVISRHVMDKSVLVGHSMAGILVGELAATHPRRFEGSDNAWACAAARRDLREASRG